MKRQYRVWRLVDAEGNTIIEGRRKAVMDVEYGRYVYQHIFSDIIYQTDEWI